MSPGGWKCHAAGTRTRSSVRSVKSVDSGPTPGGVEPPGIPDVSLETVGNLYREISYTL